MGNIGCNIIIPVYNALDYLKSCINSVLQYTDLNKNRVIIIDDCSPDSSVREYLRSKIENLNGFTVLYNEVNLGFIGTVNKGLRNCNGDVLLLNSDTEVTKDWMEKITRAAYSAENVGTVTPFTNNGTICSIPKFGLNNDLPEGYDKDMLNQLVERVSLSEYPEIPTAVGFCLYIKRALIDRIGYFDETYLEKGYFDENDFCNRALENGFINILADDTFIYHKGTMSFTIEESVEYSNKNRSKFLQRYPYYDALIHDFVIGNPLKNIHERINNALQLGPTQTQLNYNLNIVFIVHNDFSEEWNGPAGGTEYHVKDIVENIKGSACHLIIPKKDGGQFLHKVFLNGKCIKRNVITTQKVCPFSFRNKSLRLELERLLTFYNINLVHIHHLNWNTYDIVDICKERHIPYIVSVHDTSLTGCHPHITDFKSLDQHYTWAQKNIGVSDTHGYVEKKQHENKNMLEGAEYIVFPSKYYKDNYIQFFNCNSISEKSTVIYHGVSIPSKSLAADEYTYPVKVMIIGALWPHKGSKVVAQLLKKYSDNEKIHFYLLGTIGDNSILNDQSKNVTILGSYKRDELYPKIDQIEPHFILNTAVWPEAFCYTLTEAAATGTPVITTGLGAIPERVEMYGGVVVLKSAEVKEFSKTLDEFIFNGRDKWMDLKLKRNINSIINIDQMVEKYIEIYKDTVRRNKAKQIELVFPTENSEGSNSEYIHKIQNLEKELNYIRGSFGWRILMKFWTSNLPFKSTLKKILARLLSK